VRRDAKETVIWVPQFTFGIMETSAVQSIKLAIVAATGLSKDALHIYVGLAVFLAAAVVLRKPLRSIVPWLVIFAMAIAGEVLDMRDDIASLGYWRWGASLHDVLNTLFWPTVLLLIAKLGFFSDFK
jgi:hypothetical protein